MMDLRELYQDLIIDHSREPRNCGKLPAANHSACGHNPLCGDELTLLLLIEDSVVKNVKFEGNGCAISMASASLMTEAIKGKSTEDIQHLATNFHQLVTGTQSVSFDAGKLAVLAGVKNFPSRVKCATLAWHTLTAAMDKSKAPISTE